MAANINGLNPPPEVKQIVAQALSAGKSATEAYKLARPGVSDGSAQVIGCQVAALPEVVAMREALMRRSASVGVLTREQIQQMLSLAAVTPKDADSLSKPENAWMLTKDKVTASEHGETREVAAISTIDALRELSKVSGNYAPQVVQVQHSGTVKTLAESDDYADMLEAEAALARAQRGRIREVETVQDGPDVVESGSGGVETAMDAEALATGWLEED